MSEQIDTQLLRRFERATITDQPVRRLGAGRGRADADGGEPRRDR